MMDIVIVGGGILANVSMILWWYYRVYRKELRSDCI